MKRLIYLLLVLTFAVSCGNKHETQDFGMVAAPEYMEEAVADEVAVSGIQDQALEKKIIKTGRMEIAAKNLQGLKTAVDNTVRQYKAYYSSEDYHDYGSGGGFYLTIRIPQQDFENFIAALESREGRVINKNIQSEDVTEQFIDIEMRLGNKKKYLERYQELLKRAGTIKEVLEVETQIRQLEEEIESAEGRLKYLGNQVAYSSLSLSLIQEEGSTGTQKFWSRVKISLTDGWAILIEFLLFVIRVWPLWVIGGAVFITVWQVQRKNRKQRKSGKV